VAKTAALLSAWGSSLALAWAALGQEISIDHVPVGCIVAESFPVLDARLDPAASVSRARLFFRGGGTEHWYYVEMKPVEASFIATLPKPKRSLSRIDYYIEALGREFQVSRTPERSPVVVGRPGDCPSDRPVAAAAGTASVAVGSAEGAPAVPPGFSGSGLVGVSGGGLSTTTIVAGVAGAGALAAAVALAAGDGGGDGRSCPSEQPSLFYEVTGCEAIQRDVRAGCAITFQYGVGRWPTIDELNAALAGASAFMAVDGTPLAVWYEGPTWHGEGGFGNRARGTWVATAGSHTVTAAWSNNPQNVVRCTFTTVE
jgi:hypothetical protein